MSVVARGRRRRPAPHGNHFPTQDDLAALLGRTGLTVLEQAADPGDAPLSWSRRVERVSAVIAARHRSARSYALAARQGERFARLFATEQISRQLIHAVSSSAPDTGPQNASTEET